MEWWLFLLILFFGFILIMLTGLPIAFCFLVINVFCTYLFWGGGVGIEQLILSIYESITFFALLPVPLFLLMGEVLFQSGMGSRLVDALDTFMGRLPGRLGLVAIGSGVLIATLCGNTWASTAMLGSMLLPEMEKRGYKRPISIGSILGGGNLAIIIPPSGMAVVLATLGGISVGGLLMAGVIPGLVLALFFAIYIVGRVVLQPDMAPSYEIKSISLMQRLLPVVKYVLPMGVIVFAVIGLMLLGFASPTESAAFGALATFLLAVFYRRLTWEVIVKTFSGTMMTTGMVLTIFCGSTAFSQVLAFSGATKGMVQVAVSLPIHPILLLLMMMLVVMILGCFMEQMSILMICLPIFMPVCNALDWNPIWFGLMLLINMSIANLSPPFGIELFVMKAVAPSNVTMADIYRGSVPFVMMDALVILLVMVYPPLAVWLPSIMKAGG